MRRAVHSCLGAALTTACVSLGSAGCAASTASPPLTSATTTTASDIPAVRGEELPVTHPTTKSSESIVTTQAVSGAPEATLTDGQVVAIASQINRAAVAAANVVLARSLSDDVRRYALVVRSGNDAVDAKLLEAARAHGIALVDSTTGGRLHSASDAQKGALMNRSGSELDRAYVDAQVTAGRSALDLFDSQLIPSATNPEVRAALESARANLVRHLHEAQRIQVSLGAM